ncbi:unnamed protein product [Hapterophycus canaliculatus]
MAVLGMEGYERCGALGGRPWCSNYFLAEPACDPVIRSCSEVSSVNRLPRGSRNGEVRVKLVPAAAPRRRGNRGCFAVVCSILLQGLRMSEVRVGQRGVWPAIGNLRVQRQATLTP